MGRTSSVGAKTHTQQSAGCQHTPRRSAARHVRCRLLRLSAVLWVLTLGACRSSASTPVPLLDVSSASPGDWLQRSGLPSLSAMATALSPDGQWLVDDTWVEMPAIRVVSTSDPVVTIEAALTHELGEYLSLGSWAPDSSTVLFFGSDDEAAHHPFDRVILFRLNTRRHALTYATLESPNGALTSSPASSWSPDGTQVAITLDRQQILVLDKQAAVRHRIALQLDSQAQVSGVWWTQVGLVCRADVSPAGSYKHELIIVDPGHPDRQRVLYASQSALTVLGANLGAQHLLVQEQETSHPLPDTFRLMALNVTTGAIDQTQETPGSQCVSADAPDSSVTAIKTTMADGTDRLWLYDWQSSQLLEYGPVVALVGWRSNVRGFLVVTGTLTSNLHFAAVQP